MITPELLEYIKKQMGKGAPDEELRKKLRTAGWTDSDINEGFLSVSKAGETKSDNLFIDIKDSKTHFNPLRMVEHDISDIEAGTLTTKRGGKLIVAMLIFIILTALSGIALYLFPSLFGIATKF